MSNSEEWRLRRAALDDVDGVHALASLPAVNRWLFDGAAPARATIAERVASGMASFEVSGVGLWVLVDDARSVGGCVQLSPEAGARSAELSYLLAPSLWGRGLATRMAWTAMAQAFCQPGIDTVFAGVDRPNTASLMVLRRLGMRYRRAVRYPLGPGDEYERGRGDPLPEPCPEPLPLL